MLETRDDFWSVGFSHGFSGGTAGAMLAAVRRELGGLLLWQEEALRDGHEVGAADRVGYERDMRARADVAAVAGDELPF